MMGSRYGVTGLEGNYGLDQEGILRAKYPGHSKDVKKQFEGKLRDFLPGR